MSAVNPRGSHAVKIQLRNGFRNRRRSVHENQGAFRLNAGQQLAQHKKLVPGFRHEIHVGNSGRQRGIIPVSSLLGATLIGMRIGQRAPLLCEDGSVKSLVVVDTVTPNPTSGPNLCPELQERRS